MQKLCLFIWFLLKGRYATDIRYFNLVFGSFNLLCKTACGPNYRS